MAQVPATDVEYTGNGSQTQFTVPFEFISRAYVFVTVNGVNTPFTWINDALIEITPAPAMGSLVRIYRSTPAFEIFHAFDRGIPFLPRYIDGNNTQLLDAVQEAVNDTAGPAANAEALAEEALETANRAEEKVDNATILSAEQLRLDLANTADPAKGAALVGFDSSTLRAFFTTDGIVEGLDRTGATSVSLAIQVALNTRKYVRLLPGNYKLSTGIVLTPGLSGVALVGSGHEVTRVFRDTSVAAFDFVSGVTVNNVLVSGIWFDSVAKLGITAAANRHCALRFWDGGAGTLGARSTDISVTFNRFTKFSSAETQAEGNRGVVAVDRCSRVLVAQNVFEDNRATCVFYYNTDDIRIHQNYCLGEQTPYDPVWQPTQGAGSFASGSGEGASITGNRIRQTGYTSINSGGSGTVVADNDIESPTYSCITINEGSALPCVGAVIANNVMSGAGLANLSLFNLEDFLVEGNVIRGNLSSTNGGIRMFHTTDGTAAPVEGAIRNNLLVDNAGQGIRCNAGANIDISGNTFAGNASGLYVQATHASHPIDLRVNNNTFVDNTYYGIEGSNLGVAAHVIWADGNAFQSSNIATLQGSGILLNGSGNTANLGTNVFSANYEVNGIETVFANRNTKALVALSGGVFARLKRLEGINLVASTAYDPPSLGAGAVTAGPTITVAGASLGDRVSVSFSLDQLGVNFYAYVSAANTVQVRLHNPQEGTINLAAGTVKVRVFKDA